MYLSYVRRRGIVMCLAVAFCTASAWAASPAQIYLGQLTHAVEQTHGQISAMSASAQKAADRIIKGGRLLLAGQRVDFKTEAIGRAGGLMGFHFVGEKFVPRAGDVVLTSSVSPWTPQEIGQMGKWVADGAQVIIFSPDIPADLTSKVDGIIPAAEPGVKTEGGLCPTDSTMNLVDLWVWTGEYVSACTRAGKTPVLYQSYGIPGARERDSKYEGQLFHKDMHVAPIKEGQLGGEYLDAIDGYLKQLSTESALLSEASQWLSQAGKANSCMIGIGHTFPAIYQDPRGPEIFSTFLRWPQVEQKKQTVPVDASVVLQLSYQYPPELLLDQARQGKYKLIYCSVRKGDVSGDNILYIDPHWPLADACVMLKGYDIPILPPSGVMQAAIYWSIAAGVK